ncbi:MAG: HIT family protein [Proteobacteria bacterium]|nr:HIT family protein [Pseudomonadota bacterium]
MGTVFSRIIAGDLPCYKLYEDEHVLGFLDIAPLSPGHTLVIPKQEAQTLDQLSDESAAAIGRVLPRLSRALLAATGARAFNVLQNNGTIAHQEVMHVHFHIIPRFPDGTGLGIGWRAGKLEPEAAQSLTGKITSSLS